MVSVWGADGAMGEQQLCLLLAAVAGGGGGGGGLLQGILIVSATQCSSRNTPHPALLCCSFVTSRVILRAHRASCHAQMQQVSRHQQ